MKKFACLIISMVMLLSCFAGCSTSAEFDPDEPVTLTILCEEGYSDYPGEDLKELVSYYYPNISLEFIELARSDLTEREMQLTQLRTEVMAGKGPDIFLCNTWQPRYAETFEPFFIDVEKAMRNGTFLNLDPYIAASETMKLDGLGEKIMAAGKTENGQMVLPLFYSFELITLDKSKVANPEVEYGTWDEILDPNETALQKTLSSGSSLWFHRVFDRIADYDSLTLAFTQEELEQTTRNVLSLYDAESEEESLYFYSHKFEGQTYYVNEGLTETTLADLNWDKDYIYPMVLPNINGGSTAFVEAYTAINANTEAPEAAFKVLELCYSKDVQLGRGVMNETTGKWMGQGFTEAFTYGIINGIPVTDYALDCGMYDLEQVKFLNSKITAVRFTSNLDVALYDMYESISARRYSTDTENIDIAGIVADCYSDLKMMVAE